MVEGTRLEATAWMGRDGNLYTKMELTAKEVKFLGGNLDPDQMAAAVDADLYRNRATSS